MSKEINILANLCSGGGGEQSVLAIRKLLIDAGWKVNFIPFGGVSKDWKHIPVEKFNFTNAAEHMKSGLPLLFYGNDSVGKFIKGGQGIVEKSSCVIVGINYIVDKLPQCEWLGATGKLRAVIVQNNDKLNDWKKKDIKGLYPNTAYEVFPGAISIDDFLPITPRPHNKGEEFVILRHSTGDNRKFCTYDNVKKGDKHLAWQRHFVKEADIDFYKKILDTGMKIRFEFMVGSNELKEKYKDDKQFVFHEWNAMPVAKFLERGHAYLYRTSNSWCDQFPRVLGEGLSSGLPALVECRFGQRDRVIHGRNGFFCIDTDSYINGIKMLYSNEPLRLEMSKFAKQYAIDTLHPKKWVEIIERYSSNNVIIPSVVSMPVTHAVGCTEEHDIADIIADKELEKEEKKENKEENKVKVINNSEAWFFGTATNRYEKSKILHCMIANVSKRWNKEMAETNIHAQIHNLTDLGVEPERIKIISNTEFSDFMGVKIEHKELNTNCLTGSKLYLARHLLSDKKLPDDMVINTHDLDLWYDRLLEEVDVADCAVTRYNNWKVNGGNIFWTKKGLDIIEDVISFIESNKFHREEPSLNKLLPKYKDRVNALDYGLNLGQSSLVDRILQAKKLYAWHHHPTNRIAIESQQMDRNGLGIRYSRRLEAIQRQYFKDMPVEMCEDGKKARKLRIDIMLPDKYKMYGDRNDLKEELYNKV